MVSVLAIKKENKPSAEFLAYVEWIGDLHDERWKEWNLCLQIYSLRDESKYIATY